MKDLRYSTPRDGHVVSNSFKVNTIHPRAATTSILPLMMPTLSLLRKRNYSLPMKNHSFAPTFGSTISPRCRRLLKQWNQCEVFVQDDDGCRSPLSSSDRCLCEIEGQQLPRRTTARYDKTWKEAYRQNASLFSIRDKGWAGRRLVWLAQWSWSPYSPHFSTLY